METETQTPQAADPVAADTSAPVDQSAASTQQNEAPEAAQAQEGTPEVNATDTVEDKLYAGKYKSVEELEKAYQNAESKLGQTTSEKAELSRILNEAFVVPETPQTPQDTSYIEEPNPVNQEIEDLKRKTAVQSFIMAHQDADAATMQKVLADDPLVSQITGHEAKLEYAYLRSQNMSQTKAIAEAKNLGAQQAQAKVAEKQAAQVETAQKAVTPDDGAELYNRATGNFSAEDRQKARMELIRKNLVNL